MALDGVPVVTPCLVMIISDGSAIAREDAAELTRELREALVTSGPAVVARDLSDAWLDDPTLAPAPGARGAPGYW